MSEKERTGEKIRQVIKLMSEIPEQHLKDFISYCGTKVSGAALFMAVGERINFDEIGKRKKRAEAFLDFKKVLIETEDSLEINLDFEEHD